MSELAVSDETFLRVAFDCAKVARRASNHPFGAVVVSATGELLVRAGNEVVSRNDVTAHAEMLAISVASATLDAETRRLATIYCSTEPCSMCSTAIRWSGIGRIVFGLSQGRFRNMANDGPVLPPNDFNCREMFSKVQRPIEIIGPLLEDEALAVHSGFWQ